MKKQSNLSRLLGYAGKHKYLTYASWILSALSALVALLPFIYIWKIIKEVLEVNPDFSKTTGLITNGILAMVFAISAFLIYILALLCSHLAAFRVATNMRIEISEHIATLPLGFVDSFGSGKLRKIINDSTGATENYLAHQLPDKYGAIATPIGLLVLLFVFDWRLGLLSLVPVVLAFLIMSSMTGKKMKKQMKEYNNALENMSNEAVEYVRGIPVVKTFGQSVYSFKKYKGTIDQYEKWVVAYTKELRVPMMFYTAMVNGVFAFLIAGGLLLTTKEVSDQFLLNLIFYIVITPVISLTLTKIMYMSENNMIVEDALTRIDSVLNYEAMKDSDIPQEPNDYSIALSNVHFSYDNHKEVINGISINIKQGQTVAFVGPSGGGKSTLASLIVRFFDVQSGEISIGNVNIKDIPHEHLVDLVSFVFQNSKLIKTSILENVRLGKATASEEEVKEALHLAQCDDIIAKLPQGIHTVIGTDGVYLSGGEQQRITIARAILKNAPILILDEATAYADPDNETKVQKAFSYLAKDKTIIMIAHRLSTIRNVDYIYVIDDGQIKESGSFVDLINQNGLFAKMWKDYSLSIEWKVKKEGK